MLFYMKELQLGLHKYMKIKHSLSFLFFLYQGYGVWSRGEGSRGVWVVT